MVTLQLHPSTVEVTCSAPVNIAVIKYWGKRDESLLLPTNSSLSVTLSQDHLKSTTTVRLCPTFNSDRLWLNGNEEKISSSKRLSNVIEECRKLRKKMEDLDGVLPKLSEFYLHISSVNNFPTAAGLASSASGFACLTFSLFSAYQLPLSLSEVSRLARLGSGSACRSLFGGFVAWEMGHENDGIDSMAVQVAPETHWPDLEALICVVSDIKKETGSTEGMQRTVETSELFKERLAQVPKKMKMMKDAIERKDFDTFAELTMKDSNQFHSVCLDTYPPVFYMNDVSKGIVAMLTEYNRWCRLNGNGYRAAYTFDAGPNAVIFIPKQHVSQVLALMNHCFPPPEQVQEEYFGRAQEYCQSMDSDTLEMISKLKLPQFKPGALKRIISTHVGDGPRLLCRGYEAQYSLLNQEGLPKQ